MASSSSSAPFASASSSSTRGDKNCCQYGGGLPSLPETRADLRAIARKISLCEEALEGRGAYLGITDQATLLDQLKALQRKDEQLRDVLLLLLRAIPLTAPPSSPSTPASPIPSPPSSALPPPPPPPPPSPSPRGIVRRRSYGRRRPSPNRPEGANGHPGGTSRVLNGAGPAATPPTVPPPQVDAVQGQKTVSLHEALGLASPPSWEKKVMYDQGGGSTQSVPGGRNGPSRQPGMHALYRAYATAGSGSRGNGVSLVGLEATRENGGRGAGDTVGDPHAAVSYSRVAGSSGEAGVSMPSNGAVASIADARRNRALMPGANVVGASSSGGLAGVPSTGERVGVVNTCPPQGSVDETARKKTALSDGEGLGHRDDPLARLVDCNFAGEVVKAEPVEKATSGAGFTQAPQPADFVRRAVCKSMANAHAEWAADRDKRRKSERDKTGSAAAAAAATTTVNSAVAPSPLEPSVAEPCRNSRDVPVASGVASAPTSSVGNAAGLRREVMPPETGEASVLAAPAESTQAARGNVGSAGRHTGDVGSPNIRAAAAGIFPGAGLPSGGSGSPARKRINRAPDGWRARYISREFDSRRVLGSGDTLRTGSGAQMAANVGQGRGGRAGFRGLGKEKEESEEDAVDVGGGEDELLREEDGGDERVPGSGLGVVSATSGGNSSSGAEREADGDGGSAGGGVRRKARRVARDKKKGPPNAWKRRCVTGNCQLGASFGRDGQQAMYCSSHKDPGMINVTHRRCESPGCVHQPSFNLEGLKKARYCWTHKTEGMTNVCSPRCADSGCLVRPSFGFVGDRRASFCDAHKKVGMTNIRKYRRVSNAPLRDTKSFGEHLQDTRKATPVQDTDAKPRSFNPSFLSDPPLSGAPRARPSGMVGSTLSGFGDDPALPLVGDAGGGGGVGGIRGA